MLTSAQVSAAMNAFTDAHDRETSREKKLLLANAAALLAQVAEHLESKRPITPSLLARCREAMSPLPLGNIRTEVEAVLSVLHR